MQNTGKARDKESEIDPKLSQSRRSNKFLLFPEPTTLR